MNLSSWRIYMTQEIIDAVKEAKELAKPRNFTQSIDVIINIKDLDVRKPDNRFSEELALLTVVENQLLLV